MNQDRMNRQGQAAGATGRPRLAAIAALLAALVVGTALAMPALAQAKRNVYVTNLGSGNVPVFDVASNGALDAIAGSPFGTGLGTKPTGVAITPEGAQLYATDFGGNAVRAFNIAADGTPSAVTALAVRGRRNCVRDRRQPRRRSSLCQQQRCQLRLCLRDRGGWLTGGGCGFPVRANGLCAGRGDQPDGAPSMSRRRATALCLRHRRRWHP